MAKRTAKLARLVAFYQGLMRQRSDVVILTDGRGRVVEWSAGAERLLGSSRSQALGEDALGFLVSGDGGLGRADIEEKFSRGATSVTDARAYFRSEGGRVLPLLLSIETARERGKVTGMIFVGKDISREVDLEAQLRRIIAKLEREMRIDPVTGIHNRRFFDERIGDEVERAKRFRRALSLLFLDVDDFKIRVNTPHGHTVGDRVLQAVAGQIQANVRETDIVARYAGDEFVVILPETDKDGAMNLAEKIRGAVERAPIVLRESGQRLAVTISIGVSNFILSGTVEGLVRGASRAALQAKAHGRNRVWDADRKSGKDAFVV